MKNESENGDTNTVQQPCCDLVAWLHTMDNTEGLKENEPERVLSFSAIHPFGRSGIDYSDTFPVTSEPLFRRRNA